MQESFEDELKRLVDNAKTQGLHGLVIAKHLMTEATAAVKVEADVVERHNHALFGGE
jgi:hypothetical protein